MIGYRQSESSGWLIRPGFMLFPKAINGGMKPMPGAEDKGKNRPMPPGWLVCAFSTLVLGLLVSCGIVTQPTVNRLGEGRFSITHGLKDRSLSKASELCAPDTFLVEDLAAETTRVFVKRLIGAGGMWESRINHTYFIQCAGR